MTASIFYAFGLAILLADSRPQWLKFLPTHDLSEEGFRGVRWATPLQDIPWKWSKDGFPAGAFLREDEDIHIFGGKATWITYTFRNSVFYGVRIDFDNPSDFGVVERHLVTDYLPSEKIEEINGLEKRWATPHAHVWIKRPNSGGEPGVVFLWGRNRVFADDAARPHFLSQPPAKNSSPRPYAPRFYVIYRASGPVQIDGQLNEKTWQDAVWLDSFVDHQYPYSPDP